LLARLRSLETPLGEAQIRRLVVEHGALALGDVLAAVRGEPRPVVTPEGEAAFRRFAAGDEPVPVFPLGGADLLARGMAAGPEIGDVLARARETWLEAGCPTGEGVREGLLAALSGRS